MADADIADVILDATWTVSCDCHRENEGIVDQVDLHAVAMAGALLALESVAGTRHDEEQIAAIVERAKQAAEARFFETSR